MPRVYFSLARWNKSFKFSSILGKGIIINEILYLYPYFNYLN